MKLTIVYDNTAFRADLQADWGFSALLETNERRILFDTGASGYILLSNMKKLGIDPQTIDDIYISHAHFDHTGGLSAFLDQNNDITVWAPHSFRGVKNARDVKDVQQPCVCYENIYTTGELAGIEQSLCVASPKGIIIVTGCSHPPMDDILAAAAQFGNIYGIIGGLHGNRPETLKDLKLICATHCTQYKREIQSLYPDNFIEGGAGQVIEIDNGLTEVLT